MTENLEVYISKRKTLNLGIDKTNYLAKKANYCSQNAY